MPFFVAICNSAATLFFRLVVACEINVLVPSMFTLLISVFFPLSLLLLLLLAWHCNLTFTKERPIFTLLLSYFVEEGDN